MSDEVQERDPADDAVPSAVPDDAAVVDRIVDGRHAVLLVGAGEVELVVDVARLPEGTVEGDWLRVDLTADVAFTDERRSALEARMERIRRTQGGDRFN